MSAVDTESFTSITNMYCDIRMLRISINMCYIAIVQILLSHRQCLKKNIAIVNILIQSPMQLYLNPILVVYTLTYNSVHLSYMQYTVANLENHDHLQFNFSKKSFRNNIYLYIFLQIVVGICQFLVVVLASIIIGFISGCVGVLMTRVSHHVHG